MTVYDRTEADEIAENISVPGPLTWAQADAIVRANMGPPSNVGYQIFDNTVAALIESSRNRTAKHEVRDAGALSNRRDTQS